MNLQAPKLQLSARRARYWAGRLGLAGLAGILLAAAAAAGVGAWLKPLEAQSVALQREIASVKSRIEATSAQRGQMAPVTEQEKLGAFYTRFPERAAAPDLLERIYTQAEAQQVALDEGEYTFVTAKELGLDTLRISLPVKGSYPQIRKFIGATLADLPTLALENLSFRREKVGDEMVDAKVTLLLYLGRDK